MPQTRSSSSSRTTAAAASSSKKTASKKATATATVSKKQAPQPQQPRKKKDDDDQVEVVAKTTTKKTATRSSVVAPPQQQPATRRASRSTTVVTGNAKKKTAATTDSSSSRSRSRSSRRNNDKEASPREPSPAKPSTSSSVPKRAQKKVVAAAQKTTKSKERAASRTAPARKPKLPVVRLPRLTSTEIDTATTQQPATATPLPSRPPLQPAPQQSLQNPYLPPLSSLPHPTDSHAIQTEKLHDLKNNEIRSILSELFNQVQDSDDTNQQYMKVERLYNYITEVYRNVGDEGAAGQQDQNPSPEVNNDDDTVTEATVTSWSTERLHGSTVALGTRYKNMIVLSIWSFGAVIWKVTNNPYAQKTAAFLQECILRLGWKKGGNGSSSKKRNKKNKRDAGDGIMGEFEDEPYHPACYFGVNLFTKHINDPNTLIRHQQLLLLQKLVQAACTSNNLPFLRHVFKYTSKSLLIRLKDKSSANRALSMSIISDLLSVPNADDQLKKELKYYTRYDPSVEVRRIGTSAACKVERLKLRFFFDQAFDRNMSVRFEAFKAMGVEVVVEEDDEELSTIKEGDEEAVVEKKQTVRLIRDMSQLTGDKLCKLVLWGALYSDSKCSTYIKTELLRKWLKISCQNDLVKFLTNLDPFQHLVAVNKIMDMMFCSTPTTSSSELHHRFVESIDLSFITQLKANIMGKKFKDLSIEAIVGWLGLCKASRVVGSLRGKVVPGGEEMGELIECLHECVFLESEDARGRDEDAVPLFCVVVGLELCRFVEWEEGGRRHMRTVIKNILTDTIMEERILVVQAINILHTMFITDNTEFEELMLDVFQEVFDARSDFNKERRERSSLANPDGVVAVETGGEGSVGEQLVCDNIGEEGEKNDGAEVAAVPLPAQQPAVVQEPVMTSFQLTKLKDKICGLASFRLELTLKRESLIKQNMFVEAIPFAADIMNLKLQEVKLRTELREQEELIKKKEREEANPVIPVVIPVIEEDDQSMLDDEEDVDGDEQSTTKQKNSRQSIVTRDDGGVIKTIEDGLSRGMFMINAYMDLNNKMNAFLRNLYENYAATYFMVEDIPTRSSVLQFMARVAMIEKRELMTATHFFVTCLVGSGVDIEISLMAYKCLVDLLVLYDWGDFVGAAATGGDDDAPPPFVKEFTTYLQKYLDNPSITYETCTPDDIKSLFLELLTKRFPPSLLSGNTTRTQLLNQQESMSVLYTVKYQGLLKLLVRGRLRDPVVVSRILALWVNNDYCGGLVLRDLESVVKLYGTFEVWWGEGVGSVVEEEEGEDVGDLSNAEQEQDQQPKKKRDEAMRVLGVAVGEAVVYLCQEGGGVGSDGGVGGGGRRRTILECDDEDVGGVGGDNVVKFVCYFLSFLDVGDQPLMRTITTTILTPVEQYPTRSYNTILVRCASKIPITSFKSAQLVVALIYRILDNLRGHPGTASVLSTRKEIGLFVKKLKRVFGDEIIVDGGGGRDDSREDGNGARRAAAANNNGRNNNAEGDNEDDDEDYCNDVVRFSSSDGDD